MRQKSKYICPECGTEIEGDPAQKIEHEACHVAMREIRRGIVTKDSGEFAGLESIA